MSPTPFLCTSLLNSTWIWTPYYTLQLHTFSFFLTFFFKFLNFEFFILFRLCFDILLHLLVFLKALQLLSLYCLFLLFGLYGLFIVTGLFCLYFDVVLLSLFILLKVVYENRKASYWKAGCDREIWTKSLESELQDQKHSSFLPSDLLRELCAGAHSLFASITRLTWANSPVMAGRRVKSTAKQWGNVLMEKRYRTITYAREPKPPLALFPPIENSPSAVGLTTSKQN